MEPIDEIFRSLQPHLSKAQILLEVEDEEKTLEKALGIFQTNGIQLIGYDFIRKGDPSFVLFYLSTNDMRGAALNLTEAGFTRLKGVSSKEANLKKNNKASSKSRF